MIEAIFVAIARQYLFEFNSVQANRGSRLYKWDLYRAAMNVAYDEQGYVRGSGFNPCEAKK